VSGKKTTHTLGYHETLEKRKHRKTNIEGNRSVWLYGK